jgi:hypothetical protein
VRLIVVIKKDFSNEVFFYVPRTGFEPARPFGHHHLKVACLPISTPGLGAANVMEKVEKNY